MMWMVPPQVWCSCAVHNLHNLKRQPCLFILLGWAAQFYAAHAPTGAEVAKQLPLNPASVGKVLEAPQRKEMSRGKCAEQTMALFTFAPAILLVQRLGQAVQPDTEDRIQRQWSLRVPPHLRPSPCPVQLLCTTLAEGNTCYQPSCMAASGWWRTNAVLVQAVRPSQGSLVQYCPC